MIALRILDIKKFMAAFLVRETFDEYSLIEAQITTFCTFQIDGRLERDFFDEGAPAEHEGAAPPASVEYVAWKRVRERCFDLIKGKRTPLSFKFVFFYPEKMLAGFLAEAGVTVKPELVSGLCINLRFDGTNLLLTTGTAMRSFTADRSADRVWDEAVREQLRELGIAAEQL